MCGIAGILVREGERFAPARVGARVDAIEAIEAIESMTRALAARGPDGRGIVVEGRAALGHTRLAILDIEGGAQPMSGEPGVWIVYNGEIYNSPSLREELKGRWSFRSRSDTEVVLAGYQVWGEAVVDRLRGMFAFALWDAPKGRLLLARDRLGIKPLVYSEMTEMAGTAGGLVFASDLRSLLASGLVPIRADARSLADFLELGYVPAPHTILAGVRRLPPGHVGIHEAGVLRVRRYWAPPGHDAAAPAAEERRGYGDGGDGGDLSDRRDHRDRADDAVRRWEGEFRRSVNEHMLSDVPIGAFLSGGIDSSLVMAALASNGAPAPAAFTLGFSRPEWDETPWARRVAEHLGCELRTEVLDETLESEIPGILGSLGEPLGDPSVVPAWFVSRLAARERKVVFAGDGGDELFAGYSRYQGERLGRLAARLPGPARALLSGSLRSGADMLTGAPARAARRLARLLGEAELPLADRYWSKSRSSERSSAAAVLRDGADAPEGWARGILEEILGARRSEDDPIRLLTYLDLEFYLPNDLLAKLDLASMAHSLEVRVPFLDHRLVEHALGLPTGLKLRGLTTKWLLRRIARRELSPEIASRPKSGFTPPVDAWMRGQPGAQLESWLREGTGPLTAEIDPERALARLAMHREGGEGVAGLGGPLFNVLALLSWERSLGDAAA